MLVTTYAKAGKSLASLPLSLHLLRKRDNFKSFWDIVVGKRANDLCNAHLPFEFVFIYFYFFFFPSHDEENWIFISDKMYFPRDLTRFFFKNYKLQFDITYSNE